jgi:hypothetical protein
VLCATCSQATRYINAVLKGWENVGRLAHTRLLTHLNSVTNSNRQLRLFLGIWLHEAVHLSLSPLVHLPDPAPRTAPRSPDAAQEAPPLLSPGSAAALLLGHVHISLSRLQRSCSTLITASPRPRTTCLGRVQMQLPDRQLLHHHACTYNACRSSRRSARRTRLQRSGAQSACAGAASCVAAPPSLDTLAAPLPARGSLQLHLRARGSRSAKRRPHTSWIHHLAIIILTNSCSGSSSSRS